MSDWHVISFILVVFDLPQLNLLSTVSVFLSIEVLNNILLYSINIVAEQSCALLHLLRVEW